MMMMMMMMMMIIIIIIIISFENMMQGRGRNSSEKIKLK
jgi:hypothetical protein